jgi:ATP-binding cassette subfamily B protein
MRSLLPHLRQQGRPLAATFVMATLARLLVLADPQILRLIVDRYVLRLGTLPPPVFYRGVLVLIAASVVVGVLSRTFRTLQDYWIEIVARRVGAKLYARSIAHSLLLPFHAFEKTRSGELLHIIQRARQDAESGISGAVRLYLGALAIGAVTIYAFTLHPLLGFLHLVGLPLAGVIMLSISLPIRKRQREISTQTAMLTGSATEAIRNVELLKGLGAETQEIGRIHDANDRILGLEEQKLRLIRRFTFMEGILFHTLRALFLAAMLWLVFRRAITTGEFLSLFLYTSMVFSPLTEAGNAVARYQEARATFDTLDTALELPMEERGAGSDFLGTIGQVKLDGVSFSYDTARAPALHDIDVELRSGQTVAFTGPSGAGKTSLVKLLVALYTPTAGAVRVNGRDLREIDLDAYRAGVGLVTQETQLFAGTLRDNLQISRPDASDKECLLALEQAAATSILDRSGEGLDTRIGEGGLRLSGGERQRIAIARALLRNPDLLIFDEATSSLDAVTERTVTDTIRLLAGGRRLTILVSHRLSTIRHADTIHVLQRGAIVQSGTHDELLAREGLYATLWHEQNRMAV